MSIQKRQQRKAYKRDWPTNKGANALSLKIPN